MKYAVVDTNGLVYMGNDLNVAMSYLEDNDEGELLTGSTVAELKTKLERMPKPKPTPPKPCEDYDSLGIEFEKVLDMLRGCGKKTQDEELNSEIDSFMKKMTNLKETLVSTVKDAYKACTNKI